MAVRKKKVLPKKKSTQKSKAGKQTKKAKPSSKYLTYQNPLTERWGTAEMSYIFSPQFKFSTWRELWIALAEGERVLGLNISEKQIRQMRKFVNNINFDVAEAKEREVRHDVMSHVHAFGEQATSAKGIIHLGATSAYVTDNTDLIQMKKGLELLAQKLVNVIAALADFAERHSDLPTLAFTHFQPAQPTSVGKRACLWILDLLIDLEEIERMIERMPFLGVKGTTGTQASFLKLFDGNARKVQRLEHIVAEMVGFKRVLPVSGQTYTRKLDFQVLQILAGLGQSGHKFANDLRLLAHLKEIEEPFEKSQIGSSAMAYKRNPMRTERMTGLARHLQVLMLNPAMTASEQWFERTLDDSSNKRIATPEAFLTADIILEIYLNVTQNLVVYPAVIRARLESELPFIATENILMEAVKRGGDRQELHECIRIHSQAAAQQVKLHGKKNDLLSRIEKDPAFEKVKSDIGQLSAPSHFIGLAEEQTHDFLKLHVNPVLKSHRDWLGRKGKVSV